MVNINEIQAPESIVRFAEFSNVEGVSEFLAQFGQLVELRQIGGGSVKGVVSVASCADIILVKHQQNRCVDASGVYGDDVVTFVLPAENTQLWVDGHVVLSNQMLIVDAGAGIYASNPSTNEVYTVGIPKKVFYGDFLDLFPELNLQSGFKRILVHLREEDIMNVRLKIDLCSENLQSLSRQYKNATGLIEAFSVGLANSPLPASMFLSAIRQAKVNVLLKARDYIHANLHRPIAMYEICDYAGASLSSVERAFRRELNVTPSQYIISQRLHVIRQEILKGDKSVSELALQYGFFHLGRFSEIYHKQFSVLPSQDDRRKIGFSMVPSAVQRVRESTGVNL